MSGCSFAEHIGVRVIFGWNGCDGQCTSVVKVSDCGSMILGAPGHLFVRKLRASLL